MKADAKWFSRTVWIGIAVNLFFVIALCFFPKSLLLWLHIQSPVPNIWVRIAGLLLLEVSILSIPGAIDPYRFKVVAWISVLLARGSGAAFFLCAVLLFNQAWGFLAIAFVDLFFGIVEGILLFLAMRNETSAAPELVK